MFCCAFIIEYTLTRWTDFSYIFVMVSISIVFFLIVESRNALGVKNLPLKMAYLSWHMYFFPRLRAFMHAWENCGPLSMQVVSSFDLWPLWIVWLVLRNTMDPFSRWPSRNPWISKQSTQKHILSWVFLFLLHSLWCDNWLQAPLPFFPGQCLWDWPLWSSHSHQANQTWWYPNFWEWGVIMANGHILP